ncbi:MAG TPA: membrane protein insertion efficiency factor YidD [Candidatus Humimicrobiaceae bacterium]|nr:membrane protein insertion efficiency factor YidD [Candidatus Humimicrobiaceae bacterium]
MLQKIVLKLIKLYQSLISPSLIKHCRFYPSCSEYTYLAIKKYGPFKGAWKGVGRVIKCYPWHPGGVDLP